MATEFKTKKERMAEIIVGWVKPGSYPGIEDSPEKTAAIERAVELVANGTVVSNEDSEKHMKDLSVLDQAANYYLLFCAKRAMQQVEEERPPFQLENNWDLI